MKLLKITPTSLEYIEQKKQHLIEVDGLNEVYLDHIGNLEEILIHLGLISPIQYQIHKLCDGSLTIRDIAIKLGEYFLEVLKQINFMFGLGLLSLSEIRKNPNQYDNNQELFQIIPFEII